MRKNILHKILFREINFSNNLILIIFLHNPMIVH
jgi:hypothetical protein